MTDHNCPDFQGYRIDGDGALFRGSLNGFLKKE